MRPVPSYLLLLLLLALCGLCAWQWQRESQLRQIAVSQRDGIVRLTAEREELESRAKRADAEILRLNGSFNELRASSVSKQIHEEVLAANAQMRESIEKQNTAIKEQNEALMKQSQVIQQANESIKKLAAERDDLIKRVNDVSEKYNKLVNAANKGQTQQSSPGGQSKPLGQ